MSFCGSPALPWEWKQHSHSLMADLGGASCIHCGLRVPRERVTTERTTACPCHLLWSEPDEILEGTIMLRGVLALRACWQAWFRGADPARAPTVPGPPRGGNVTLPRPPPQTPIHWPLTGTTLV